MSATKGPWGLAAAVILGLCGPAHAWHDKQPATDYSASVLLDGEMRLGLFKAGFGLTDWLQLETYTVPWLLRVANLSAKAAVWRPGDWTFALELGLMSWNPKNLPGASEDAVDVPVVGVPLTAHATWHPAPELRLSGALGYTVTKVDASDVSDADLSAVGAVSTGRAALSLEYRFGRVFAAVLEGHVMLYESIRADGSVTTELDEDTTVTTYADSDVDLGKALRGLATLSGMWSWQEFNLRVGLGYGHYRVPMISFFVPEPFVVPELALFWRF